MNTPSHAVVNLALLGRSGRADDQRWIALGSVLPDLPIFLFAPFARWVLGHPWSEVWGRVYFSPEWQAFFAPWHSFPLIAAGWLAAGRLGWTRTALVLGCMFLHSLLDLPLHHDDAHRHLWPLTDWRFASPVSYWDPAHLGRWGALAELVLVALSAVWLLRSGVVRSRAGWVLLPGYTTLLAVVYLAFHALGRLQ